MPSARPREFHVGRLQRRDLPYTSRFFLRLAASGGQAEEKTNKGSLAEIAVDGQRESPPDKRVASKREAYSTAIRSRSEPATVCWNHFGRPPNGISDKAT